MAQIYTILSRLKDKQLYYLLCYFDVPSRSYLGTRQRKLQKVLSLFPADILNADTTEYPTPNHNVFIDVLHREDWQTPMNTWLIPILTLDKKTTKDEFRETYAYKLRIQQLTDELLQRQITPRVNSAQALKIQAQKLEAQLINYCDLRKIQTEAFL